MTNDEIKADALKMATQGFDAYMARYSELARKEEMLNAVQAGLARAGLKALVATYIKADGNQLVYAYIEPVEDPAEVIETMFKGEEDCGPPPPGWPSWQAYREWREMDLLCEVSKQRLLRLNTMKLLDRCKELLAAASAGWKASLDTWSLYYVRLAAMRELER